MKYLIFHIYNKKTILIINVLGKRTPFEIHVETDGTETAAPNTPQGAGMKYQQLPC